MNFGEKINLARKHLGMSRDALAEVSGLSKRSIAYYELEGKKPKQRSTYDALALALHTDAETLMDDDAEFAFNADDISGERGQKEARKIVGQIKALYAGGDLNEQDIDAMMLAIQDAYWIAKKKLITRMKAEGAKDDESGN